MREQQMLDAAVQIFSVNGYHETSMDAIAAEAEISKPMLYLYYGSKEELFGACLDRELTRFDGAARGGWRRFREGRGDADPDQQLRAGVAADQGADDVAAGVQFRHMADRAGGQSRHRAFQQQRRKRLAGIESIGPAVTVGGQHHQGGRVVADGRAPVVVRGHGEGACHRDPLAFGSRYQRALRNAVFGRERCCPPGEFGMIARIVEP